MDHLQIIVDEIAEEMALAVERGKVADYIPNLAAVSPAHFGMAIVSVDGSVHVAGDAEQAFSVQSITKVFGLTMALGAVGDALWSRVGREPSGSAFNSIVQLETEKGIPRNPFINAGAIVVSDILLARYEPREAIAEFLRFMRALAGDDTIVIDDHVARGEEQTGFRNAALASYMRAFGNVRHPIEKTLGIYFHQCALAMNCRQLALAGRFLMCGGRNPETGRSVVSPQRARRILALMLTCGHYDGSGEFAYRVGLPGKSGVGGGILSIAPGIASIAVWSPGLNERGNSHLGTLALERLVQRTGWSVFEPVSPDSGRAGRKIGSHFVD
ncbi:glutaminase [Novosphingobium lentum]|uniref:glutaminase n=1 Tax=Novosphingobium lentum TaxID=145287 RepID=UPI00083384A4|nr:glutaminase [Novosphingobium lentum]